MKNSELGGSMVNSSARYTPVQHDQEKQHITAEAIEKKINMKNDYHKVLTTIIALENTISGQIHSFEEMKKIKELADKHKIRLHLDGARLWNASVATGVPVAQWCSLFETVSLCFSKGKKKINK